MGWFTDRFLAARTVEYTTGPRIDGLQQAHEIMRAMGAEDLLDIVRKSKLYADDSTQTMTAAVAEKVLREKGYSRADIKQQTSG